MKRSKILIFTFLFAFIGLMFCGLKVSATTPTTSNLISVEGAQVRTSGTAGIRFVGNVDSTYDKTNVTAYGVLIAFGEANVDDVVIGGKVNDRNVLSAQVSSLNGTEYYVNLINIPEDMYGQDVTTRAYVVDNGEVVYADSVTTRSLGQVTLAVKANGDTSTLIEEVFTTLSTKYKNTYADSQGNVFVTSAIYETVPSNLEKVFVSDWNAKFGTTMTEYEYTTWQASAIAGTTPLTENTDTNCSGTNAYEFFVNDEETSAKWGWLLTFFLSETSTGVHPKRQINALLNNGTYSDSYGSGLQKFGHLSRSLHNFFEAEGGDVYNSGIDIIIKDLSVYGKIANYNNTILATPVELITVGTKVALPEISVNDGYTFNGYMYDQVTYNNEFTSISDNVTLTPVISANQYTITYYNGEELVHTETYTVENEHTLYELEVEGYDFNGWCESSTLEGDLLTEISKGSTGDKVYYASLSEKLYDEVNVTYDLNGGYFLYPSTEAAIEDFLKDYNAIKKTSHTAETYFALGQWGEIGPASTFFYENPDMMEKWTWLINYIGTVASSANKAAYTNFFKYDNQTDFQAANSDYIYMFAYELRAWVGQKQYTQNDGFETADYSTEEIKTKSLAAAKGQTSYVYKEPCDLETPIYDGFTFDGWKSSVDNSVVTQYPGYSENPGDITYTAQWLAESSVVDCEVTFDYNGGVTEELFKTNGTQLTTLSINSYNGSFWSGTNYASYIFISDSANDPTAKFGTRIYIGKNSYTNLYNVISIQLSDGSVSVWPDGADYVITISSSYTGTLADSFSVSSISVGDVVLLDKTISEISSSNVASAVFYASSLSNSTLTEKINNDSVLPTPAKVGYEFDGWYDSSNNKYDSASDFAGKTSVTVTAKWIFIDQIIGEFEDNSWVVAGSNIQLLSTYLSGNTGNLAWKSNDENIATVTSLGTVAGVSEGVANIVVYDADYPSIKFDFYVTVFAENPTGLLQLIANSNNAKPYTVEHLVIGDATEAAEGGEYGYYADIIGSVSQLFFVNDFEIKNTYLLDATESDAKSYGLFTEVCNYKGVEFITFHYAADTPYSSWGTPNGGASVASWGSNPDSGVSYHFGVGNDGVFASLDEAYAGWHAGTGSRDTDWSASGVYVQADDPEFPVTTLGSDGYFYINGRKTNCTNTTEGSILSEMGFATKVVDGQYYMPDFWYSSSYNRVCSQGGNLNSIGIESSVRNGSDLWLTWHYSAQLCAYLLDKYDLPITQLVGHCFWSGKWCPQPMLENDLEIWYIFRDMVKQELSRIQSYNGSTLTMSTSSSYISSNGRIKSQPVYSECVTYDVTYTYGGVTKTVTLSTIIPGTEG